MRTTDLKEDFRSMPRSSSSSEAARAGDGIGGGGGGRGERGVGGPIAAVEESTEW